jgi:hypothetical protein
MTPDQQQLVSWLRGEDEKNCKCSAYGRCDCACGVVWAEDVAGDAATEIERQDAEIARLKALLAEDNE